jgi:uncharacterized protein YqeY
MDLENKSSTLKDQIQEDVKTAMRSQDKAKLAVLRLVLAAFKQREVDERITLDHAQSIALLDKLAKQRRESIQMYQQGNRPDLVEQEEFELNLILSYLPKALSEQEINEIIQAALQETGASSIKDMGKLMAILRPKLQGRADMSQVSELIKKHLG